MQENKEIEHVVFSGDELYVYREALLKLDEIPSAYGTLQKAISKQYNEEQDGLLKKYFTFVGKYNGEDVYKLEKREEVVSEGLIYIRSKNKKYGICSGYTASKNESRLNLSIRNKLLGGPVKEIGANAFRGCTKLHSITIPDSVKKIGLGSFAGCSRLWAITLPNKLKDIGDGAFWGCDALKEVVIPNSVVSIGDCVFLESKKLKTITIPNSVTKIKGYSFGGCKRLKSVTLPNKLEHIGCNAFGGCHLLVSIKLPNTLKEIGGGVFAGCRKLSSITIPNSVTKIDMVGFGDCRLLTTFNYDGTVEEWESDKITFGEDGREGCPFTQVNCSDGVSYKLR